LLRTAQEDIMNIKRRVALGLAASIPTGLLKVHAAAAAPSEARLPADNPMHRYIGAWHGDVTVQTAGKETSRYVQENAFTWTLGGRFMEERGTDSNGGSFAGIWAFDAKTNKYRAHYFIAPSGDDIVLAHAWDQTKQGFVGSADLPDGMRILVEDRFFGADSYIWTMTIQDKKRATLSYTEGKERRVRR
jgi:hypothetical protein